MILIETSVVLDQLRTRDVRLGALFASLPGCWCGITRSEVLRGARNAAERHFLTNYLNVCPTLPADPPIWDLAGEILSELDQRGSRVPFQDAVIAAIAVAGGFELWTRDLHFPLIQTVVPSLRLFPEPP